MSYRNSTDTYFLGSIDDLYDHCIKNIDVDTLYAECEKREAIEYIAKNTGKNIKDSEVIYEQIRLQDIQKSFDKLIKLGMIEEVGKNKNGETKYKLTKLGLKAQKELNKKKKS